MEVAMPEFVEEYRAHFNEPVLHGFDLVRLVGYGETAIDCYVICRRPNPDNDLVWVSCVGGVTFLDRLNEQRVVISTEGERWSDYYRLDTLLELNGAPKEAEFILDLRPNDYEGLSERAIALITEGVINEEPPT